MPKEQSALWRYGAVALVLTLLVLALLYFSESLADGIRRLYALLLDRERTQAFIQSFGPWAPLAFMAVQVGQVILAPVPGEATGFIGGYLFGAWKGFFFSTLSLSLGSWINFKLGRLLGARFVRRLIPAAQLARFDQNVRHRGTLVVFLLFVFPGFPKDYLCLFLGVTRLPTQLFLIMAIVGRMPGTLMLSLQGAMLFERMYGVFAALLGICGLLMVLVYRYRAHVYTWAEKFDRPDRGPR